MKILVVGGDGMLGHQLLRQWLPRHNVKATVRKPSSAYASTPTLATDRLFYDIDIRSPESISTCIAAFRPDVIVNAAGIVKQRSEAKDPLPSLEVNSVFPHRLAVIAKSVGARVVHFSTDCVFSGRAGNYTEDDFADADDLYGRTKLLGELDYPHCLTVRSSIVGRELFHKKGLLEWFLAQRGTVHGFTRAVYTGFTTLEMARIIERLLSEVPQARGIWQVSSDPITKYDLLHLLKKYFNKPTTIVPDDSFECNRSLDSSKFRSHFNYTPPTWDAMVAEISRDKVSI